ncbi:hypothetical protein K438DRAFT_1864850, partial [Mycena galopus ATCC 62051]
RRGKCAIASGSKPSAPNFVLPDIPRRVRQIVVKPCLSFLWVEAIGSLVKSSFALWAAWARVQLFNIHTSYLVSIQLGDSAWGDNTTPSPTFAIANLPRHRRSLHLCAQPEQRPTLQHATAQHLQVPRLRRINLRPHACPYEYSAAFTRSRRSRQLGRSLACDYSVVASRCLECFILGLQRLRKHGGAIYTVFFLLDGFYWGVRVHDMAIEL